METDCTGQIDAATTRDAHFAGFDDESAPRSKHDVMKEVIAKSKLAKYERQKIKDADEELRMELDDELGNIRSLLFTQPNTEQSPSVPGAPSEQDKSDTYDAFVREMAYERRARPQDRLKSAEELAEEQAKRLHEAEAARLRRMRGEQDEEGAALLDYQMNEEEDDEAKIAPDDEPKTMRSRFGLGAGLDGLQQANANAETDEEDGDSEGEEDEEKNEVSEEEDEDEDDDNDNDEEDVSDTSAELADYEHLEQHGEVLDTRVPDDGVEHNDRHVAHTNTDAAPTLPFTFPCPSSHDAFLNLLEEHHVQPSQINTVVSRIRTLHAPNLAEENPAKLQRFLSVLVDHVLYRAGQPDTQADDLRILNDLVLHIYELAKSYPLRAAEHFVAKLALMQRNLMRGLAHGALDLRARTWPRLAELMFLRMCMILWPTSDKWHAVTTPMYLLMAQYLAHARTRSLTDMASALYLCSLVSSAQHASRRIVPEALNALFTVAAILLPQHRGKRMHGLSPVKALAEEFGIPTPDVEAEQTGQLVISADATPHSKMSLADVFKSQGNSTQIKADLLRMCVELMQSFAQLYKASSAFVEMFTPMLFLLEIGEASLKDTAPSLVPCVHEVVVSMRAEVEHAHNTRHALRLQAHRALSIASYAPKFEQQSFDPRRATDPDTERANAAKLRAMLKKERKGAIRELRKDAQFIAEERDQRRVAEDTSYKKKIDKIVGGIQSERSEEKQLDRAKALIRKRAGKR